MRRPWNLPCLPVYSLSTFQEDGGNMNICTYVTAISMQPKRYMVGVYKGTKTLENIRKQPRVLLQLLGEDQYRLVRLLGQQSGNKINKIGRLSEKASTIRFPDGVELFFLKDAVAFMSCAVLDYSDAGDHFAYLLEVSAYRNLRGAPVLTTCMLREKGIIRA
jgi:flavin reductase (DIM6/NTAB) family NADH-FMN oxidoreductase RutF